MCCRWKKLLYIQQNQRLLLWFEDNQPGGNILMQGVGSCGMGLKGLVFQSLCTFRHARLYGIWTSIGINTNTNTNTDPARDVDAG